MRGAGHAILVLFVGGVLVLASTLLIALWTLRQKALA